MERGNDQADTYEPWPEDREFLHICPDCESPVMLPRQWERTDRPDRWRIWLSCGECSSHYQGVFSEDQVDGLDEVLDAQLAVMNDDLRDLEQSNMKEYAAMFSSALQAGHIIPEDF